MDEECSRGSDDADPLSSGQVVVCRPNPQLWWLVAFMIVGGGFFAALPIFDPSEPPMPLGAKIFFEAIALVGAIGITWGICDLLRAEVRADANGLTWRRGITGWKSARWEEISDLYRQGTSPTIETPQGKLILDSTIFAGNGELVELIPLRAVNSSHKHWVRRGLQREENWSVVLSPWSKAQQWMAPVMGGLAPLSIIVLGILASREPRNAFSVWQHYDAADRAVVFLGIGIVAVITIGPPLTYWHDWRLSRQHRDETLTLDAQGLVFSSETTRIAATWAELRSIERLPKQNGIRPFIVRTAKGDFTLWVLPNWKLWIQFRLLVDEYAPHALEPLKKQEGAEELNEDLDGELGAWSGNSIGEGARVFSFRSRGNRLILLCMALILNFIPCIYLINTYIETSREDAPFAPNWAWFWIWLGITTLFTIAGWLWFKRAAIWVDEAGLLLHSPFHKPRRIRWENIESRGHDALGEWVRTRERQKIRLTPFFKPLRRDELVQLIEDRGQ